MHGERNAGEVERNLSARSRGNDAAGEDTAPADK
jgi:hypothetical protein